MKHFFIDVETTGVDPVKNGLVQFSGRIVIDGVCQTEINEHIAPRPEDVIEQSALDVIGYTAEDLKAFGPPDVFYRRLIATLDKYVRKFDRADKFHFIGYNSRFDDDFLRQFFIKNSNNFYGSYFWWPAIDVANLAAVRLMDKRGSMPNFKLMTVARALGIEVDESKAHDALYDIDVTQQMYYLLTDQDETMEEPNQ
jgi:DNA polymerase-3 subunit epsilon